MTCNRKLTHAVRVETITGGAQIILFKESAGAQTFTNIVNDGSDGRAEVIGLAHELPVTWMGQAPSVSGVEPEGLRDHLAIAFHRASTQSNARLIELREVAWAEDDHGGYWKALALWAHGPTPPPVELSSTVEATTPEGLTARITSHESTAPVEVA